MVQSSHASAKKRYGTGVARKRHNDLHSGEEDAAWRGLSGRSVAPTLSEGSNTALNCDRVTIAWESKRCAEPIGMRPRGGCGERDGIWGG